MSQQFNLQQTADRLRRTPILLKELLLDLPDSLIQATEGSGTWSAYDVVGHLIHGEKTDWIARARRILEFGESKAFDPFDREGMRKTSQGKTLAVLLNEFEKARQDSLQALSELNLSENDLERKGLHPALGTVTLKQLLATWIVHDLDHVSQIVRILAKYDAANVGPWHEYLSVLKDRL